MFTGLVEMAGEVLSFAEEASGWRLRVDAGPLGAGAALGDSVAVNGCCLTVVANDGGALGFDLLGETIRRTSFEHLRPGDAVNLERSLSPTTRMGGHFVSGHIDGAGAIETLERRGDDVYLAVRPPPETMRYLAPKGSVALDGVSLTVADVAAETFAVWLIPHTLERTNLGGKRAGDRLNLEVDLLAKYVERLLAFRDQDGGS